MYVVVKANGSDGFEDQLTDGKSYPVIDFGDNGVVIRADDGVARWYGSCHFDIEPN